MHVIATAGHVDHGKSTLVRALTGMEPDRWSEERRRGMTIDLGFAWTTLAGGQEIAFVDVPGHERFTTNMLAGVGPVPAVLLVVAADDGWSPQTTEHVSALDALGVSHAVLAVTRSDLADPAPVVADCLDRLAGTSLGRPEAVAVAAPTGQGLADLGRALERMVGGLPPPCVPARVRLWVDRAFTMRGFGTVLTGTLGAGSVRAGDRLDLGDEEVVVRGLECLGRPVERVESVARVAVNLRSVPRDQVARGQALLTPGAWHMTDTVDVRAATAPGTRFPRQLVLHIGSAAVPVRVRALDDRHLRLRLGAALPLQAGDRTVLRDPGLHHVVAGAVVLDAAPPPLTGRGAGRARAGTLAPLGAVPAVGAEVARRKVVSKDLLIRLGVTITPLPPEVVETEGWLIDAGRWEAWGREMDRIVDRGDARSGTLVHEGIGRAEAVDALGLPDPGLLGPLVAGRTDLEMVAGRVRNRSRGRVVDPALAATLQEVLERLERSAFDAPSADDLLRAGLGRRQLAVAAGAGGLLVLPGDVVLRRDAPSTAIAILAGLRQPFTTSEARQALGTSRRVAVPLLEHLDRSGLTRRIDDTHRRVTGRSVQGPDPTG